MAPFGRVRFRDFFMADLCSSMVVSINDSAFVVAYFASGNFIKMLPAEKTQFLYAWGVFSQSFPFWLRCL